MSATDPSHPYLSICVPVYNEEQNVPLLIQRIEDEMSAAPEYTYEVVMVDDRSTDSSWDAMLKAAGEHPRLRCIRFSENRGESAASCAAMNAARGSVFMTIDADLENDPSDIPAFLEALKGVDCVCGTRVGRRKDGFIKNMSSRIANAVRNGVLRDRITDAGCTYRAFKRECFESVRMYNGFHRFLPTLFKMEGFSVTEIPVKHCARLYGESKYGVWNRLFKSFADMLVVRWMGTRKLDYSIEQEVPKP